MKTLKTKILASLKQGFAVLALMLLGLTAVSNFAFASNEVSDADSEDVRIDLRSGALFDPSTDVPSNVSQQTGGNVDAKDLGGTIINWALGFLGFIAVAFVIYGGFLMVTAGGDDGAIDKGKKIITYAGIGIIIILISAALVNTISNAGLGDTGQ